MICTRCLKDRQMLNRRGRRAVVMNNGYREYEKQKLKLLVIVAGVLLLIVLMSTLGWLPPLF